MAANDRTDDVLRLRATLASIAPGTTLRDGLERILRARSVREGLSRLAESSILERYV